MEACFIMALKHRFLLPVFAAFVTCAVLSPLAVADDADLPEQGLLLAQNTTDSDTDDNTRGRKKINLPLPATREIITTEKPIEGVPRGVIFEGKPKDETAVQAAPAAAAAPAPAAQTAPVTTDDAALESAAKEAQPANPATMAAPSPQDTAEGITPPAVPVPSPSSTATAAAAGAGAGALAGAVVPQQDDSTPADDTPAPVPQQEAAPQQAPVPQSARSAKKPVHEELSLFNVPTNNLRTMKLVIDDDYNLTGMVYGEERGFIRILQANNNGVFRETWKSPPLNAPVREVFVVDLDQDGETDIVTYTTEGNIFIFGYYTHDMKYRTPEDTYQGISCMIVENVDDDPQLELLFINNIPGQPGNLVQFDTKSMFDEFTSTQEYMATDMMYGNVDTDAKPEIILNTGEVLDSAFKSLEYKSDDEFGDRIYLIDLDGDDILEVVAEYDQQFVRIYDIDERREKW